MKTYLRKINSNTVSNAVGFFVVAMYLIIYRSNLWLGILDGINDFLR
jgi:hypothetical protein